MKQRVLYFLLCAVLCIGICPAVVFGAEGSAALPYPAERETEISIETPVTELEAGDAVYLQICVSDAELLYAFSMVLEYDKDAFAFLDIRSEFADETTETVIQQTDGRVVYALTNTADGTRRDQTLATLTLKAKRNGTFSAALENLTLVYDDLSYTAYAERLETSVTIGKEEEKRPSSGGGSGGGGGRRPSGTISVSGGGYTSVTAPVPSSSPIPAPTETPLPEQAFTDLHAVPWAHEAIAKLAEAGVLHGYDGGIFLPEAFVTRAEFAKMICAAFQLADIAATSPAFPDVAADAWYARPVTICAQHGILSGDEAGFRPSDPITRAETAAVLERTLNRTERTLMPMRSNVNFDDEADIAPFAVGAVDLLYIAGIIDGDPSGCFRPNDGLRRAEAAKVIYEVTK